ncbi:hypothetical protein T492DRAFT_973240 [Pavlovales sp. CCMP2436]|nr:hypothetical protein T492DRAFT_973240 [Pavlovales sp. CCMP2436]|mmetsp:Transcript_202/g.535  ORF Transcript_202/g.535 Transcript_202/m.535 type:complete len:329 (+) Transcript_202:40-1026(+)
MLLRAVLAAALLYGAAGLPQCVTGPAAEIVGSYYKVCPVGNQTIDHGACGAKGRRLVAAPPKGRRLFAAMAASAGYWLLKEFVADALMGYALDYFAGKVGPGAVQCRALSDLETGELDFCKPHIQHPVSGDTNVAAQDRAAALHYKYFEDLSLSGADGTSITFAAGMSSAVCKQVVAQALCLNEFPACGDCTYQTPCLQICSNLNTCSNKDLCKDCNGMCSSQCGEKDEDTTKEDTTQEDKDSAELIRRKKICKPHVRESTCALPDCEWNSVFFECMAAPLVPKPSDSGAESNQLLVVLILVPLFLGLLVFIVVAKKRAQLNEVNLSI